MYCTDKFSQHSSIIWPFWLNGWVFIYEVSGCGFESRCSYLNFRYHICFKQGVRWHSGNCGFTLKHICNMIITYSQLHHTGKFSQHSSIIWPVWLNCWVFVFKLTMWLWVEILLHHQKFYLYVLYYSVFLMFLPCSGGLTNIYIYIYIYIYIHSIFFTEQEHT